MLALTSTVYIPKHMRCAQVLSGGLYLGNDVDAQSETVVRNLGITHIVNATRNIPNAFEHVKYHNVSCHDDQKTDIMKFLDGVYTFVSGALKEKGTVLVHCNKGISRSSTCVIWLCLKLRVRHTAHSSSTHKAWPRSAALCLATNTTFKTKVKIM